MSKKQTNKKMNSATENNGSFINPKNELNGHPENPLTTRELQILQYYSYGFSAPEMAKEIFITSNTIDSHRKSIIRKMGVKSLPEAVAEGIRQKLIR